MSVFALRSHVSADLGGTTLGLMIQGEQSCFMNVPDSCSTCCNLLNAFALCSPMSAPKDNTCLFFFFFF